MTTQILPISDPAARSRAHALIQDHQVIAAPTDTVYGLMCRYDSAAAIEQLYVVKNRPPQKAIPVLIADEEQLDLLVAPPLPPVARFLMARFWPGALTLILAARPHLPAILTAGQPTVAVRMPDHDLLRELMRQTGPLAATSANLSGQPEAHSAEEVLALLPHGIPLILADTPESGREEGPPSTIVDVSGPATARPAILRVGPIADAINRALDEFGYPPLAHADRD
ncbi:threonylcarbamoyl-AMP synthase [Litorilinea aerophila]|nr:L-threonylcarbamoyladenylate synthase [Litorilinea aerophila]MCC9078049.1 threonylcarbamoyl-AMP synthase [Litorilinea aerophila]